MTVSPMARHPAPANPSEPSRAGELDCLFTVDPLDFTAFFWTGSLSFRCLSLPFLDLCTVCLLPFTAFPCTSTACPRAATALSLPVLDPLEQVKAAEIEGDIPGLYVAEAIEKIRFAEHDWCVTCFLLAFPLPFLGRFTA